MRIVMMFGLKRYEDAYNPALELLAVVSTTSRVLRLTASAFQTTSESTISHIAGFPGHRTVKDAVPQLMVPASATLQDGGRLVRSSY